MCRMARGMALLAVLLLCVGSAGPCLAEKTEERPAAPAPTSPAPAKNAPIDLRLPPDLVYEGGAEGGGAVVFRHTTHVALAGNNCLVCHPGTFKLVHPDHRTSHDEMAAGKACGACHDGKKAFGITDTDNCQTCHSGSSGEEASPAAAQTATSAPAGKAAAPRTGPRDVKLARSEESPGPVTFRHSSHGGATAKCARCHPTLFPMKAGDKPLDYEAMLQGATCGACHNGKEAFGVDDSDRCERCHAEEEESQ